jgi:exoribonuclease R
MKALRDSHRVLAGELAAIRAQYRVPEGFPPEVVKAAELAARRQPTEHADRTSLPFVTLDPASSTDLDQAFVIEAAGNDLLLRYAIADVPWFVADGDPVDAEAWARGTTTYLPDGKAGLYPPALAERAASLLPDGPRPALILAVRVDPEGISRLDGVERALIRSQAKLAYATVRDDDLPPRFADLARRIDAAEDKRGAARVEPPQQEVERDELGRFQLGFRPMRAAESRNAALSLAANLAVGAGFGGARPRRVRVMAAPDARAELRLRGTAAAFGLNWPETTTLEQFERTLDGHQPREAAFMLAARRAGQGASYAPFHSGERPWHAAVAATYAHATAPLRRLADRYVLRAALAVANGRAVSAEVTAAFQRLPAVMARAEARDGQIERAVIDLAETVLLSGQEGQPFAAIVTDVGENGARIQLCDLPVVARVSAGAVQPGERLNVRLTEVDPGRRILRFETATQ